MLTTCPERLAFSYLRPGSVDEALAMWAGQARPAFLAGGTDVLPRARREGGIGALIDLKRIPELDRIEQGGDGGLAIGAACTVHRVAVHPLVRERYPVLSACLSQLGSFPIRNRATLAGNICNASPCADGAPALLALEAVLELRAAGGAQRTLSIGDFFRGPGETALRPGELLCRILLPAGSAGARGSYQRLARRRAVDISSVAVLVARLAAGERRHRICLSSVAPTPLRAVEAERVLDAEEPDSVERAAELAMAACAPIDDLRGSAAYRRRMVGALLGRAVDELRSSRQTGVPV
ncbi:MAG: FAD binding domain-containing protein [Deltaproteobacteria bacterium]|nr:FAD binding domain-containing protein [Deltaproteobacteria bacterium]